MSMIFKNFNLHAIPVINDAYCTNKKCKKKSELFQVSNGILSTAFFCKDCHSVYLLKLERQTEVSMAYLQQCFDELERSNRKLEVSRAFSIELESRKLADKNKKSLKKKK